MQVPGSSNGRGGRTARFVVRSQRWKPDSAAFPQRQCRAIRHLSTYLFLGSCRSGSIQASGSVPSARNPTAASGQATGATTPIQFQQPAAEQAGAVSRRSFWLRPATGLCRSAQNRRGFGEPTHESGRAGHRTGPVRRERLTPRAPDRPKSGRRVTLEFDGLIPALTQTPERKHRNGTTKMEAPEQQRNGTQRNW